MAGQPKKRAVQAPKPVSNRSRKPPPVGPGGGIQRKWLYLGAGIVVAAVVAVLIVVSLGGGDGEEAPPIAVAGQETEQLLRGVPQDGNELGEPSAPVTLVEFADLQCPFCQEWALDVLPTLIDEYVRTGDVRIIFRGIAFIGPDSNEALRYAYSAGEQNKLWNVVDLTYKQQGSENSDWVTPELMRGIGEAVPGLDVDQLVADIDSPSVGEQMDEAAAEAQAAGVQGTPTFLVGPTGGQLDVLGYDELSVTEFREHLDEALAG